jgi:hypothetical protein
MQNIIQLRVSKYVGWLGSRASLDAVVKRKLPSPYRDSNPPSSSP